jgi:hypothetical protein
MRKKFINSQTTRVFDKKLNDWVYVEVQKLHTVTLEEFDRFYMVYFNMMKTFYQIKYLKDVLLLVKLCEDSNFNSGLINLSTQYRVDLCSFLNIRNSHLSSSLKRLSVLGLLIGNKGKYTINEGIFWKGDREIRDALLKDRGLDFIMRFKIDKIVIDEKSTKVSSEISMPEGDEDSIKK